MYSLLQYYYIIAYRCEKCKHISLSFYAIFMIHGFLVLSDANEPDTQCIRLISQNDTQSPSGSVISSTTAFRIFKESVSSGA